MIPLFRPSYDQEEERLFLEVLRSRWVGLGPKTEEFEQAFAAKVGSKYGVAVNSCTAALHLSLESLGIGPGDEVLVPTITFASTAHVVKHLGATPVFCDVDPETLILDPKEVEKRRTPQTKAVIQVLYAGLPKYLQTDLPVIYDAAHAAGSSFDASGKLSCWSFHAVKNLAIGDGGMITTDDIEKFKYLRKMRWLGIEKGTWDRAKSGSYQWEYEIPHFGYKCHLNDLLSAIGLAQLSKLDKMQEKRRDIAIRYLEELPIQITTLPLDIKSSLHLFVIRTPYRDELLQYLTSNGISVGVHYKPLHLYPIYDCKYSLPNAEQAFKEILTLPLFPDLTKDDQSYICQKIQEFCRSRYR
jgi:perosamine synthetase